MLYTAYQCVPAYAGGTSPWNWAVPLELHVQQPQQQVPHAGADDSALEGRARAAHTGAGGCYELLVCETTCRTGLLCHIGLMLSC